MVKPGFSQAVDASFHDAQISHAVRLTGELVAGKDVSPEEVGIARESLLAEAWSGAPGKSAVVLHALATLYARVPGAAAQGELLGELIAAGTRAKPVLNQIARDSARNHVAQVLAAAELQSLFDSVSLSPEARLQRVVALLDVGRGRDGPGKTSDSGLRERDEALNDRRATRLRLVSANADPDGGPSPPSGGGATAAPARTATGGNFPEEIRLDAVLAQGAAAIPDLVNLLRGNSGDRELGCTALMHLARNRPSARDVYDHMRRLETDPTLQPVAEPIRREAEGHGGSDRQGMKQANVGDGWLRRAIDSCEPSAILRAAAGREVLAIPLAVRKLVELRSK